MLVERDLQFNCDDWINRMLATALLPNTGAVGITLIDANHRIIESGWFIDPTGRAVVRHAGAPVAWPGYFWSLRQNRNVSFVVPGCMLVRWSAIDALGAHDCNDTLPWYVQLCAALRLDGKHMVVAGNVHAQSKHVNASTLQNSQWPGEYDGLLNPNLAMIEPQFIGHQTKLQFNQPGGAIACAALPV
jgi:hypothetical protein